MKFSSKVVIGVFWIVLTCFTFGGTLIIDTNFQMLLLEQKDTSRNVTETIYNLLKNETKGYNAKTLGNMSDENKDFILEEILYSMNISMEGQKLEFNIFSRENKYLYNKVWDKINLDWIEDLQSNKRAYTFEKFGDKTYIQTIRPFVFLENEYYIAISRDISYIFENHKKQYEVLINTTILLSIISVLMSMVFSKVLLHQVLELNRATEEMGEGNIEKRADIRGNDELAILARKFNKMADSLQIHVEKLELEAENKENFVAAFSHEIKTPLTAIIGYADMLRTKPDDERRIQKGAEYIFSEGKRLERLSKRLLQIMSIKNQELEFVDIEIKSWIESLLDHIKYYLEQDHIKLECSLDRGYIKIEPELINMVIMNIIDNAKKASSEGGTIYICGKIQGDNYNLQIEDKGIGIEAELLSKIKEPFFKADPSRARNKTGAGLGLSLVQSIMEKHDAKMDIYSEIDKGTIVVLRFKRRTK